VPPGRAAIPAAEDLLRIAERRWGRRVALATSFQAGGMVLLDLASRVARELRVLTIDTGRLPAETYELIETVRARYGIEVEVLFPETARVEAMMRRAGPNLFRASRAQRMECCATRKSAPFRRALAGLDAWITGARRQQSAARAAMPRLGADIVHAGVVKVAPLADWSDEDVWAYLNAHEVPYHQLYDRGYRSIGCAPCTRPVGPGEDPRAGRWWWEAGEQRECGLHARLAAAPEPPGGA
jgi:phosphoadenosine phosphosulfate reductase